MLKFLAILLLASSANASEISAMKTVGKGELNWMFWTAYEAELLSADGKFAAEKPFALKLTYKLEIDGKDIADRSAEEMRGQKSADEIKIKKWQKEMLEIFPNVKDGDEIVGISNAKKHTIFMFNNKLIARVDDADFTAAFFDIWLSEKTTEPALRKQLLAGK